MARIGWAAIVAVTMSAVGCDDAELGPCVPTNAVTVGDVEYCVFPGAMRRGARCPLRTRYPIDLPSGYVCASTPQDADELPEEVCALFDGRCVLEMVADAGMDAEALDDGGAGDPDVRARDAGPALDASPPRDARPPSDAGGDAGAPMDAGTMDLGPADAGTCLGPSVSSMALGVGHACVIAERALYCWGTNVDGQIGIDTGSADVPLPARVGTSLDWASVSAGEDHTCGIRTDGSLWCWGEARDGRLGLPEGTYTTPTRVGARSDWARVACGYSHTCAITTEGELRCWGANDFGQLGTGSTVAVETSTTPALDPATEWVAVDTARAHACALTHGESVRCWGRNGSGELGLGTTGLDAGVLAPGASVMGNDWLQVEVGGAHTCARDRASDLYCWGSGSGSRLGLGFDMENRTRPTRLDAISTPAQIDVAVGDSHTCAIGLRGILRCFGDNDRGQLGNGTRTEAEVPTAVAGDRQWEDVAAGEDFTCGLDDGVLLCWGEMHTGPTAGPGTDPTVPTPVCLPVL